MSVFGWFAIIVAVTGGAVALARLPAYWAGAWTGPFREQDNPPTWWVWGHPLWRAYRRGFPLAAVTFFLLGASFLAAEVLPGEDDEGGPSSWAAIAGGLALVFAAGLGLGVALLNRPKWAVAPRHRLELGLLQELRRARDVSSTNDRPTP